MKLRYETNPNDRIEVLMCGNDAFFDGMLTAALSLMKRTDPKVSFSFRFFTMDLTRLRADYRPIAPEKIDFFARLIRRYHPENSVRLTDVTALYEQEFAGCPNEGAYCSPYTLIRLLADLADGMPDKFLYLDADVLFARDARLLFNLDLGTAEYAAARDHYGRFLIRPDYVNAGVLLFNLKRARQTGLFRKARALLRQKKLVFADQSALIRATTERLVLPRRFNDQRFLYRDTVVRHFSKRLFYLPYPHTEHILPWQVSRLREVYGYRAFDDILDEYLAEKHAYEREVKARVSR